MLQDYETEVNVLAGMLLSEKLLYEGLAFTVEHFYFEDNKIIFETIEKIAKHGRPDFKTVYKELRDKINADSVLALQKAIVSEDTFEYWAKRLHDTFIRRSYWLAGKQIMELCESEKPIEQITELVESRILRIHAHEGMEKIIPPEEAGQHALEEFERRLKSEEKIHGIKLSRPVATGGIPTTDGFPGLDQMFRGLRGGDLIIIAARTGDGKTALAQNIVRHASIHQQYRTFYQNTEMKPDEIVFRFVAMMSGVSFGGIDSGELNSWEQMIVRKAFERYCQSRVFISELPMLTPERSRSLARQFKIKYGQLDLLVIDYIGRMELENSKGKQEWQILRDVAKECKRLAQELDAAVLLLSQLTEEGKLQGAKAIANEADGVLYLEPIDKDEINQAPQGATHKLTSIKARRGVKGNKLWISFNKDKMYITEVVK